MSEIGMAALGQRHVSRQFDYETALALVDDVTFKLLGKNPCTMIEWLLADVVNAHRAGFNQASRRHMSMLSITAAYLGATPIERVSHEIERLLSEPDIKPIGPRLDVLRMEVERFLPLLRERLRIA